MKGFSVQMDQDFSRSFRLAVVLYVRAIFCIRYKHYEGTNNFEFLLVQFIQYLGQNWPKRRYPSKTRYCVISPSVLGFILHNLTIIDEYKISMLI